MDKKNKKIKLLIIGSHGMLGQELVKVFKKDKAFEITAWDKEDVDIADEKSLNKKIKELEPSVIVNSAAYNAVDKCENLGEYKIARKINGIAPGNLAKIAKKIGALMVHYSSDYVFDGFPNLPARNATHSVAGGPEPQGCSHSCGTCNLHDGFKPQIGFKENDKPKPISNYGKSKLLGEKEVQKNIKKYYIIRTSKIFGKPAKTEGAKKSFFDLMIKLGKDSKNKKNGVKAVNEEISCFTYASDLAKKSKEIIDAKKPFGIYHVVNSDPCTWYEATVELYKQAKIKTKIIPVDSSEFPRPAQRPFVSTLLNTKLNPMRSYKEALKDYLKKK